MKRFISLSILMRNLFFQRGSSAQSKGFSIAEGEFRQDGKPVKIHSGEMHYARIPKDYWRHRLQMMRGMGLDTVATYVFWNYHEPAPGQRAFDTGNKDLAGFIKTVAEEGLYVILPPRPYVCVEWLRLVAAKQPGSGGQDQQQSPSVQLADRVDRILNRKSLCL